MSAIFDQLLGGEGGGEGPPPTIPDPEPGLAGAARGVDDPEQGGSEVDSLRTLIAAARDYTAIPTVEESEKLEVEKCITIFQKLLADNQRMADQLAGANPAVRKALGPARGA